MIHITVIDESEIYLSVRTGNRFSFHHWSEVIPF